MSTSNLLDFIERGIRVFGSSEFAIGRYQPGLHDRLVEYEPPEHAEEIERYWTDPPFAFVVVYYDTEEDTEKYHTVEPSLTDFESELLDRLRDDVRDQLVFGRADSGGDSESVLRQEMQTVLDQYGIQLEVESFYKIFYYLHREFIGYGLLDPLMDDPHIEDISCDGYDKPIFIYHDEYGDIKTNIVIGKAELDDMVIRLAQMSDKELSVGEPITNATLPDGSRGELVYGEEVSAHGSAFTIRRYEETAMTPVDLINYGTFSLEQMTYFWLAIENNMNLIFAGGTASGKTTSLNAVSMFIPKSSKVITIEDTREISLANENWLASVTREGESEETSVGMYTLLRSALRHRPEYMIVGEVRGKEALTLFQAMNTGHTTYSTMHADSIQTVINRLENDPINVPRAMIQSLDILSVQRQARVDGKRVRRSKRIVEIAGIDQQTNDLNYSELYEWDIATDTFNEAYTDSDVLDRIAETKGWSTRELREEFQRRKRVLSHLVDLEVSNIERFTRIINQYRIDPDSVMEWIEESKQKSPQMAD
ncbi:MAG: type II/IV secretion system ATPase subunit [Natronomonas sp.]